MLANRVTIATYNVHYRTLIGGYVSSRHLANYRKFCKILVNYNHNRENNFCAFSAHHIIRYIISVKVKLLMTFTTWNKSGVIGAHAPQA